MSDAVLVTGAFGLVGSATVKQLAAAGRHVVATDLETEATRNAAAELPSGVNVRWADLTDPAAVETLLAEVSPAAVIHLAAVIPPLCYANPALAYKVNVGATANLVKAAEAQAKPPRLVQASSIKVEAEAIVRASHLNWVILRLGGVLTTEPNLGMDPNLIFFEGVLPTDGRLQTVDVRDVAFAFAAATTADVLGQTLLIGGDDSHRLRQGDIGQSTSAAMGLVGALPPGRKGDPNNDGGWFATDWMDSATAQQVLKHQHYSWPDMLTETADKVGWKRYLFRVIAPVAREYLKRQSPYYGKPAGYGNPWEAVRNKWGAPENDGRVS